LNEKELNKLDIVDKIQIPNIRMSSKTFSPFNFLKKKEEDDEAANLIESN
jgi:hypothetical protein